MHNPAGRRVFAAVLVCLSLFAIPPVMATPAVQVGFSPEGSAQQLVLNTLDDARKNIRLTGYSFTSPEVVRALIRAARRGVDVKVVLDDRANRNKSSVAAINLLVNAGIPVRTVSTFKILHDKYIVTDGQTVQTGSFNYSRAAAVANSENVVVLKEMPAVAQRYLSHWQSRWDTGIDQRSPY